jgi:hypothetical protein
MVNPWSPHTGTKRFNGKIISIIRAKSIKERKAKVKAHTAKQCKHANRSAKTQVRQLCQAERRDCNNATIARNAQLAEAAAASFKPVI